ncbi:MAG: virulence RhuM family protein [Gemmatimonadota bacterium]|nr:virulence RhuM family protein [Gemmatimonadota bacterium]
MSTAARSNGGELILYQTEDGATSVQLRVEGGTVWLTQLELAELFQTTKQNISLHVRNILQEGELAADRVVKEDLTTAADGKRYRTRLYNLDLVLAVGYRVRSARGTQFRQWATERLREYLVKGFVMDDARLQEPGGWDYFDELLARVRTIRASEKRFYQKVRDLYTTAVDYDSSSEAAQLFFKKVQNKMLWAITGQTAAELIAGRSNPDQPNMGLQSWKGAQVRKQDVTVAKNYLNPEEIEALDRIVVMYLDYAEDQARRRQTMTMAEWAGKLDTFLTFNERELLTHAGRIQAAAAEALVAERYEEFDAQRRLAERELADRADLEAIEELRRTLPEPPRSQGQDS